MIIISFFFFNRNQSIGSFVLVYRAGLHRCFFRQVKSFLLELVKQLNFPDS